MDLREIAKESGDTSENTRHWFSNEKFDIYLWKGTDDRIVKFQLCYKGRVRANPNYIEEVVSWSIELGMSFHYVDSYRIQTPILEGAPPFDLSELRYELSNPECRIDSNLKGFILDKLEKASTYVA